MKRRSDGPSENGDLRKKLIGLGETSVRKSYYPQLQQRLAQLERFRALLNESNDAIFLMQIPQGRIEDVNRSACRQLCYDREHLTAQSVFDLLEKAAHPVIRSFFAKAESEPKIRKKISADMFRRDGTTFPAEIMFSSMIFNETLFSVAVARDISERIKLEEQFLQAQKMEAVGRLAAGVAHDFNNLLTVIMGYADLLRHELQDSPRQSEKLHQITRVTQRAAAVVQQLLIFSRKQNLQSRPLDINEVLKDMEKMLRRLIGEDIELRIETAASEGSVRADPSQIHQVLMNLAVNARDAMPRGGRFTIETEDVEIKEADLEGRLDMEPGLYALIRISDTGEGMDKETLNQIFDPFFTTKESGKGTGLGLSTVYGIIKKHKGHIWVYSEPERGTVFKIYLPRIVRTVQPPEPMISEEVSGKGQETILLVEDDEIVREIGAGILERFGYTVIGARDGNEAISAAKSHLGPIDLMVTDMIMPNMGGKELADRMAEKMPEMPVLFISGYTDTTISDREGKGARVDFLQKPFSPQGLIKKVRSLLDGEEKAG